MPSPFGAKNKSFVTPSMVAKKSFCLRPASTVNLYDLPGVAGPAVEVTHRCVEHACARERFVRCNVLQGHRERFNDPSGPAFTTTAACLSARARARGFQIAAFTSGASKPEVEARATALARGARSAGAAFAGGPRAALSTGAAATIHVRIIIGSRKPQAVRTPRKKPPLNA